MINFLKNVAVGFIMIFIVPVIKVINFFFGDQEKDHLKIRVFNLSDANKSLVNRIETLGKENKELREANCQMLNLIKRSMKQTDVANDSLEKLYRASYILKRMLKPKEASEPTQPVNTRRNSFSL